MYLLLGLLCCSGNALALFWTGGGAPPSWTGIAPFIGANLFALGCAIWPRRCRAVRALLFFELGLAAAVVVLGGLLLFTQNGFDGGPLLLGIACALTVGVVLAWRTYHELPLPTWLMPVRGKWARRLAGGVAVLLLQPISPGMLVALTFALPDYARGPAGPEPSLRLAQQLFLVTLPFYLAPLYQFLVDGKNKHLVWHPTLDEMLAEHRAANPGASDAFARLVLRLELPLHRRVCELGDFPYDAAAKTRDFMLEAWQTWGETRFDELTEDDLPWMATQSFDRTPSSNLRLEFKDLWIPRALSGLTARKREMMRHWLIDPSLFAWMVRTWSEPDQVIAAELRTSTFDVLSWVAAELTPREATPPIDEP